MREAPRKRRCASPDRKTQLLYTIYHQYSKQLYWRARRNYHLSHEDAEDVLQEVFRRVVEHTARLDTPEQQGALAATPAAVLAAPSAIVSGAVAASKTNAAVVTSAAPAGISAAASTTAPKTAAAADAAAPAAPAAPTLRVAGRLKKGRMAAALVAAAVLLSTAVLAVSQGWWQRLLPTRQDGNLLLDTPAYSADAELSQDWPYFYLLTRLPEGYTKAQSTTTPAVIRIEYSTPEGTTAPGIFFEQHRAITQMGIDTDGVVVTEVTIGDYKGQLRQKNGMNSLYWAYDEYLFVLDSEIPAEELIAIAASLKKIC